jgi:hypothetical protein
LEVNFLVQNQLVVLRESVPGCHTRPIELSITLVRLGFEALFRFSWPPRNLKEISQV